MRQIKDAMRNNLSLKLISVLTAVVLWLFVLNNSENPFQSSYYNVPLVVIGESELTDHNLGLRPDAIPAKVRVEVEGRKDKLSKVTEADFTATIDLTGIRTSGERSMKVQITNRATGVNIVSPNQNVIRVPVENVVTKTFKVEVEKKNALKTGYQLTGVTAVPDTVSISGLESVIKDATAAKATLDLSNINKNYVVTRDCRIVNKNGEDITDVKGNIRVDLNVDLAKEIRVEPDVKYTISPEVAEKVQTRDPLKILVSGPMDILDKLEKVSSQTVQMGVISKDTETKLQAKLPDGVKLVSDPSVLKYSVQVEALVKRVFQLTAQDIAIRGVPADSILKAAVKGELFDVTLSGRSSDLDKISVLTLKPTLVVEAVAEAGTKNYTLQITLPTGIRQEKAVTVPVLFSASAQPSTEDKKQ